MRFIALSLLVTMSAQAQSPTLKLWHAYRGAEKKALEQSIERFTKDTQIPVEVLAVPYDGFSSKLAATIPNGVGPDVFLFAHERVPYFARQKVVAPVGVADPSLYSGPAIEALKHEGRVYGFPLSLKCLAVFRNTKLAPQAVTTTDQWTQELERLSAPRENRFGLAYEAGDPYFHAPFLFGIGAPLFDAATGKAVFTTPAHARAFAYVKAFETRGYMPQEVSGALVKSLFNEQRVAFVISGPWFSGEINDEVPYEIDPLPTVSETSQPLRPFLGVEAAFVAEGSKHPQAAAQLAEFLSLATSAEIRATVGKQVPALLAAAENEAVRQTRGVESFLRASKNAVPTPTSTEMVRVWEPMKLALRALLQGEVTADQAGALAERRYKALHRDTPPTVSPVPYALGALALIAVVVVIGLRRRRSPDAGTRVSLTKVLPWIAPAGAGIVVLVIIPLIFGVGMSLFHHEAGAYSFVGFANFADIIASRGYRMTEPLSFYFTLGVTILWTAVNIVLHVSIGLALALLLRDPLLKLRGVYRMLLIVPWAVPNYITAMLWKSLFHRQFGAMNAILAWFGVEPISWFTHFSTSFAANVVTNTWLGFPFMMVVALGALQSIPADLYEAAEVDGASRWAQFRHITLPLLRPALMPSILLGIVWTFNMFNIIYLVSGGEPGGATDILVSEAYRWAFERNEQYGFASAYAVLIFFFLLGWSRLTARFSKEEAAA